MNNILLVKTMAGALAPADDSAREVIGKLKTGQGVSATIKRARNVLFHRKFFALINFAFDHWEPEKPAEYKGQTVAKDRERFRKDITILAGFYRAVYNARSEVRLEAESLSFASMDEDRFESVYRAVFDVIWNRILKSVCADEEEAERVVNELLAYE